MIMALFAVSSMILMSCGTTTPVSEKNTDIGLPAHEYNIYLSTEITTVLNQLTTRMSNGRTIASGAGGEKNEVVATEYSISVVEECLETIKDINITGSYTDDMDEAVRLIEEVLDELNTYKECVNSANTEDIRSSISRMEMLFTSLTAVTNQVYK